MKTSRFVNISDFCRTGSGTTPSRQQIDRYYGGAIPWVKSGELRETAITRTEEYVTEAAIQETALKLVPSGALLVAMYGATVGRVGRLGVDATTNQAVCHIIPDPTVADGQYMFHALCAKASELVSKGVGGAQPNINQGTIKDTKIYLPPLAEQKRIAAILDQADQLRRKRQSTLQRLDFFHQAILDGMLSDDDQDYVPLSDYFEEIRIGPFGSLLHKSDYVDGGIPLINPMHISGDEIVPDRSFSVSAAKAQELDIYRLRSGDVIIGRRGEMGRCAVVRPEQNGFLCGTGSMILRTAIGKTNPFFISALIRSKKYLSGLKQLLLGLP